MTDSIKLTVNGEAKLVSDGATIISLLDELQLNPQQLAVEVNLELVPREEHSRHVLRDGDRIEVVTLVGGG